MKIQPAKQPVHREPAPNRKRLVALEAYVQAARRIWNVAPPPMRYVVWAATLVTVAAMLRLASLFGVNPLEATFQVLAERGLRLG